MNGYHEIDEVLIVPAQFSGFRVDQVAAQLFPDYSRSRLQTWIKNGSLMLDGAKVKSKDKVYGGEKLTLSAQLEAEGEWVATDLPINIVFEDEHFIVINKPVGLVVHPAAGHFSDTLLNGLLYHRPDLKTVPRAGIVHRLDKDTSGLMVVAKTLMAHKSLVDQLKEKTVHREYVAIVHGVVRNGGVIDAPIARHPTQRIKMSVVEGGKEAVTHFRVLEKFHSHTLLQLNLETGRTHQIRVHLSHIKFPIVGDPLYGRRSQANAAKGDLLGRLGAMTVQALHARKLAFLHPETKQTVVFESSMRDEMNEFLVSLRAADQSL